jgi:hypothetical protein
MTAYSRYSTASTGLAPATIVAIASAGHSGSTLLDLLIGNHSRITSAGEMNRVSLYAADRACACGEPVASCPYWERVRRTLSAALGRGGGLRWDEIHTDVPPQMPVAEVPGGEGLLAEGPASPALRAALHQAGVETGEAASLSRTGTRDLKWKLTEPGRPELVLRHEGGGLQVYPPLVEWKNPLRVLPDPLELTLAFGGRGALETLARVSRRAADYLAIGRNSWHVADAMAAATGARYVVDSSKSAVRLKLLYLLRPEAMRIVWLVRDGRAVAASAMRRRRLPAQQAARTWKRENQHLDLVLRAVPERQKLRIRYEALCADPAGELRRVCDFLELPVEPGLTALWERPVHNIPGNPMLFQKGRKSIHQDDRWRRDLTAGDVAAFEHVAGRMNRGMGYA